MTILNNDRQYSFDLSSDVETKQKEEVRADVQVVCLSRVIHNQERIEAVRRLQGSQIFDTSRFEGLIGRR